MAKWLLVDGMYMTGECPCCGYMVGLLSDEDRTHCPNCGVEMEQKTKEEIENDLVYLRSAYEQYECN